MNALAVPEVKLMTADGAWVVDTRPSAVFVQGFIPQSIHIPYTENFTDLAGLIIEPEMKLIILAEAGKEALIARDLVKTGFANVLGVIEGGYEAWINAGGKKDLIIDISADEFELDFNYDEFYLIDLRTDDLYEAGHLEYAENVPLADVEEAVTDLNPESMYYLYGGSFEEAAFAGSLFKRAGIHKLRVVFEGYEELAKTNIPVAKKKKPKQDPNFSAN